MSIKDDYLRGSNDGYDLEVFHDHVGVSGNRSSSSQIIADKSKVEAAPDLEDDPQARSGQSSSYRRLDEISAPTDQSIIFNAKLSVSKI